MILYSFQDKGQTDHGKKDHLTRFQITAYLLHPQGGFPPSLQPGQFHSTLRFSISAFITTVNVQLWPLLIKCLSFSLDCKFHESRKKTHVFQIIPSSATTTALNELKELDTQLLILLTFHEPMMCAKPIQSLYSQDHSVFGKKSTFETLYFKSLTSQGN